MNKFYIISGFFFIGGVILLFFGLEQYLHIRKLKKDGIKTVGIITNKIKKKSKFLSGSDEYSAVYYSYEITYNDFNDKKITIESNYGDQTNLLVGDQINLIYNKEKTDDFIILIDKQVNFYSLFIIISVVFIILSLLMIMSVMYQS